MSPSLAHTPQAAHKASAVLFGARESTEGEGIGAAVFIFCRFLGEKRYRAGGVRRKCHQGKACESRAAEIVVIYLNICFCMACRFCSPEDMQRRGDVADRWSRGIGRGPFSPALLLHPPPPPPHPPPPPTTRLRPPVWCWFCHASPRAWWSRSDAVPGSDHWLQSCCCCCDSLITHTAPNIKTRWRKQQKLREGCCAKQTGTRPFSGLTRTNMQICSPRGCWPNNSPLSHFLLALQPHAG